MRAVLGLNDLERELRSALGTPTDSITSSEEVRKTCPLSAHPLGKLWASQRGALVPCPQFPVLENDTAPDTVS